MKFIRPTLLLLSALSICLLIACSKDEKPDPSVSRAFKTKAKVNLLQKLQKDTLGYVFIDTASDAYKKFTDSPYSGNMELLKTDNVNVAGNDSMKVFSLLQSKFAQNFLIPNKTNNSETSQVLVLAKGTSAENMSIGAYFYSEEDDFYLDNFDRLKQDFIDLKFTTEKTPSTLKGKKKAHLKAPDSTFNLSITADENLLALASSPATANGVLATLPKMQIFQFDQPEFTRLKTRSSEKGEFAQAYLDLARVIQFFPQVGALTGEHKALLNLIPRQLYMNSIMAENYAQNVSMYLPSSEFPVELQTIFDQPGKEFWGNYSTSTIFALNVNLNVIYKLIRYIGTFLSEEELKELNNFLPTDISPDAGFGFAVSNFNITGFPDGQIILTSSTPQETIDKVKKLVSGEAAGQAGQLKWERKEIGGHQTDYVITPFGIGLYLAAAPDKIFIATSELALQDLLSPPATLKQTIAKKFNPDLDSALFSAFLDYAKIYRLATNMRGMMAMFVPPDQSKDMDMFFKQLEQLKQMGSLYIDSNYSDDILSINMASSKPDAEPSA